MSPQDPAETFVQSLTESQNRLYGYIYSLLGDHHRASDVLQESNLVLWRKAGEFRVGADFIPWAFAIARFQLLGKLPAPSVVGPYMNLKYENEIWKNCL